MPFTIFFNNPGTPVPRNLLLTGSVPWFRFGVGQMSVQIGAGGQSFAVHGPGPGGNQWGWQGIVPSYIRPGQAFTAYVTGVGSYEDTNDGRPAGEHETVSEPGEGQINLILEDVHPTLSVDEFQSPLVTTTASLPFVLQGYYTSGGGDPSVYNPQLTYQVDGDGPHPMSADPTTHRWGVSLNLAPGVHAITVRATDNFTALEIPRTLTVLRYAGPITADPAVPQTATHAPTTASVTSWMRLEPQVAGADLADTTRARLFDPLWLMTRQWQIGEFQGEDAGSPVQARLRSTSAMLSRAHMGELTATNLESRVYNPAQTPLEALVERRRMRPASVTDTHMLNMAVDAGLHFLRMVELDATAAKYRATFLAKYALQPLTPAAIAAADEDSVRFCSIMAGRAPDARQLAAAIRPLTTAATALDATLNIAAADAAQVRKVMLAWLSLYDGLFTEPNSASDAWTPSRLEYAASVSTRFSTTATDEITLSASEFGGGRLDWSSFDVNGRFKVDSTGDRPFKALAELTVPAPVTFRGAPAARFWELEDAKIAYGLMTTGPTDLAHLLMIEYASSYGNDWYVTPVTLPVGSVTRVESLVVTDTFGVRTLLRPIGDPALPPAYFSMWQQASLRPAGAIEAPPVPNRFFLAPALSRSVDGAILEDVLFMRDEMANLAWGIERSIESSVGAAMSLAVAAPPPPPAPPPAPGATPAPLYSLSTVIPENWIPLMPVPVDAKGTIQLKRAITLQSDGSNKVHPARSEVLRAANPLAIYDEEIPREGVRITRQRRMARWTDGSTWVWTAYRNSVGRGEGSAGLRFDQVDDGGTTGT